MNKTELIAAVAEKTGLAKKDAEAAVKAVTETISAELVAGNKVQIVGFGTFEVSERAARQGRNPRTGESMEIAAAKAPKFKPGKTLKMAVNVPKKKTKRTRKAEDRQVSESFPPHQTPHRCERSLRRRPYPGERQGCQGFL